MWDRPHEKDDPFQQRLKDALQRAAPCGSVEPVATLSPDEFGQRLKFALEGRPGPNETASAVASDADTDLQLIEQRWPHLSETVKSFIVAMAVSNRVPQRGGGT